MSLSNLYISPALATFAQGIGVSAVNLAQALQEGDFTHLDHDELVRLRASCTSTPQRKPDPIRALTSV